MSHIPLGFINKELCGKIYDGPFYFQSGLVRVFCVLTVWSKLKKDDQWSVVTSLQSLWWNLWSFVKCLIATEVLHFIEKDCHALVLGYLPNLFNVKWCGNTFFSPLLCHVCWWSQPFKVFGEGTWYFIWDGVCHFPTDLAWAMACYMLFIDSFACTLNNNYWAVDRKSTQLV